MHSPEDPIIAIMGMTGAGKSTFISQCTGESPPEGADGLFSCEGTPSSPTSSLTSARHKSIGHTFNQIIEPDGALDRYPRL